MALVLTAMPSHFSSGPSGLSAERCLLQSPSQKKTSVAVAAIELTAASIIYVDWLDCDTRYPRGWAQQYHIAALFIAFCDIRVRDLIAKRVSPQ